MENNDKDGTYIVRDKRATYMGGYSLKLGRSQALLWATECAKQSRGTLYLRKNAEAPEEEVASYLNYGRKPPSSKTPNKKKGA